MTIHAANNRLLFQLYHIYDNSEAANIADLVMENITGWKRIDRIIHKEVTFSRPMESTLEKYISELLDHKPVQYVLKEAWFAGLKFIVNENVLIPRPETEELAGWIISTARSLPGTSISILDIGTGSGCLAVAIKKKLPGSAVFACDISTAALEVAKQNADLHSAEVVFIEADILDRKQWNDFPYFDFIISNPPYIPISQKQQMNENVVLHEPHPALFVTDEDPLVFYRAIATFSKEKLLPGGYVFVEIHEDLYAATAEIFTAAGFGDVEINKDMQGKNRMIRAN